MLKKLFSLTVLLLAGLSVHAQQTNIVYPGANHTKTTIIKKAEYGFPQFLSGDSRYISGVLGGSAGFAYDLVNDTCYQYPEYTLPSFISPDHYAGQDDPGETEVHAFAYYNGQKMDLQKVLSSGKPSYDDVFITTVQGNGEKIVAMVYRTYDKGDGSVGFINMAAIYDGKTGKLKYTLPDVWNFPGPGESALGFGSRGDCISGDGTVVGGHSTCPFGTKGKWSLAFWDISDPDDIRTFGLEGSRFDFGSFYGVTYDGSMLVGTSEANSKGVIVRYDKTRKEITQVDTIAPLPGWDFLAFTNVSDDGLVIGYCGMAADPGTREAIVYSELTGLVKMSEFLYEYYNIDIKGTKLYTPLSASRDGSILTGFFYNDEGYPQPYYHSLNGERILPRPRKISARAARGDFKASITWQQPFKSEHTLQGYNVYRNDETTPLNSTLLATDVTTYPDEGMNAGRYTYYVEAVYTDGSSMKAASNGIQVVGPGQAFPVQTLNHHLEYNRYATLFWGIPSSEVAALAHNNLTQSSHATKGQFERAVEAAESTPEAVADIQTTPQPKSYINSTLDYIANVDMLTYSGFAAIKIGDYYYTASHMGGGIQVLDQFNEVVRVIAPKNLGAVMAMVYMEETNELYCGSQNAINIINLDNDKIVNTYPVPARFLAYVPELDGGKGGFVAGTQHGINTYKMPASGKMELIEANILDFKSIWANGAAYHKNRLYIASASGPYYNEVYVYDFAKREQIGEPIQMPEDPALYNLLSLNGELTSLTGTTQAGSLSICELEDGTTALGMVFQCAYITSRFMLLELESNADVKGYDLYRSINGGTAEKLNDSPLISRRYPETLTQPGKYAYYVEVVSENNPINSAPSPIDIITIDTAGACPTPTFSIRESNRWPVMEWWPGASETPLVGFNLYRDEQLLGRFWVESGLRFDYVDDQIKELGTYQYKLEALYDDGCVATTTKDITLTGKGAAAAPFGLTLATEETEEQTNVMAKWETPMFEEPLSLRYCNGFDILPVAFEDYYECWAAIGWDSTNLPLYKDLYLVGMEYLIGANPKTFEGFVILNNQMVHTQPVARALPTEWQTLMFDKSFPMDQPHEVVVGYHTAYTAENVGVLVVDQAVVKTGFSDLVTLDGERWSTLKAGGITGSWTIGALVVHKRDLDAAKKADGSIDYQKLAGSVIHMAPGQPLQAEATTLPASFTAKPSAKDGLTLTGFNLYRRPDAGGEDVKLNDALLTTFEFTDVNVPQEAMVYTVSAVYADKQEYKTEKFIDLTRTDNEDDALALSLSLYPNPTTDLVNINGEYETLQIFDMGGRLLRSHKAATQVSLADLQPGTYFFRFTGVDGRTAAYKVVVR